MIKITFYKKDGYYYKFVEDGHAGYAEAGEDIVCSAVSAMTMLVVNAIEVSYASNVDYQIEDQDEKNKITVTALDALPSHCDDEKKQYAVSGIMQSYFIELMDMLENEYEYIDVCEIDEDDDSSN